mgnify:CR=1 FL=1
MLVRLCDMKSNLYIGKYQAHEGKILHISSDGDKLISVGDDNKIKCKNCEDIIESTYRHDFKFCKCGAVAVDCGRDYLRRCGDLDNYEDDKLIVTVEYSKKYYFEGYEFMENIIIDEDVYTSALHIY